MEGGLRQNLSEDVTVALQQEKEPGSVESWGEIVPGRFGDKGKVRGAGMIDGCGRGSDRPQAAAWWTKERGRDGEGSGTTQGRVHCSEKPGFYPTA